VQACSSSIDLTCYFCRPHCPLTAFHCVRLQEQVYGAFYRRMSKKVQTELAEANSVAEEALSTMTTVKAHAAEDSTMTA
jgi:ABC-type multidrug transport system fused ATPase/permease subunit